MMHPKPHAVDDSAMTGAAGGTTRHRIVEYVGPEGYASLALRCLPHRLRFAETISADSSLQIG
jgi:hypothetical protein